VDANATNGEGGFDYRWQDIPATARALAESPLYAFHYLKKAQRKQKQDSIPVKKAIQYLQYAHYLSGDQKMTGHARRLTQLYRQFYRARRWNSNIILQPVTKAARAILDADARLFGDPESLTDAVYGALYNFIECAYKEQLALPPRGSTRETQQEAMREFARYFVHEIFFGIFRGDKSALRGKQLNLLKNACEVIYLDEDAKDKAERELAETNENGNEA
jgi:CRISPR-associated protein Csc3